jgi:hypothetical protein
MHGERSRQPGLTTIRVVHGLLRAHVIKSRLEQEGIPALLEYESVGPVLGLTFDGLGEVRILVSDECADEARAIIADRCTDGDECADEDQVLRTDE